MHTIAARLRRLRNRGLLFSTALLGLITFAALAVAWPIIAHFGGSASTTRAAVAALLCLVGAEGALVVGRALRGPENALLSLMLGMTLRTGIPMIFAIFLHFGGNPLANVEFLYYLGGFYAITLTVGVYLSLPP
jgi:hypothetical protein